MNPGSMRYTLSIYKRGNTQNTNGYGSGEKTLIKTIRGERIDAGTREIWEAEAAKIRNVVNFHVRPCPGIQEGMWLECDGQWHEIIAIQRGKTPYSTWTIKTTRKTAI